MKGKENKNFLVKCSVCIIVVCFYTFPQLHMSDWSYINYVTSYVMFCIPNTYIHKFYKCIQKILLRVNKQFRCH